MRIVCISDTHGMHDSVVVPPGDVLLHAGDVSGRGTVREIERFSRWFAAQPHQHKVVIAGNHDFLFEEDLPRAREIVEQNGVIYLHDSGVMINGLEFWGSPWQPWFHDWAFNLERGAALAERWNLIPESTDVLVTHGPPMGVLDRVARGGHSVGCEELAARLAGMDVGLHAFGHIHEAYGVEVTECGRVSVNASCCTLRYEPVQPPMIVDWDGARPQLADQQLLGPG